MNTYRPSADKALNLSAIDAEARRLRAETVADLWRDCVAALRSLWRPAADRAIH